MRLIYDKKYPKIDRNMSDGQMRGRQKKSCKNNLFIINGLIHEVNKSKKMKAILLQLFDYKQMFDGINLEEALNDLYDVGVEDDNLDLLHQANKEIHMAIKTPSGLTERQTVTNSVLQGDTWGSILASVQVDSIAKECVAEGHTYKYKNKLDVGFLGLVDDIVGVTEAGYKAQKLNAFINLKTAEKGLQFGPKKCKSMLVGKNVKNVINSGLQVDEWTVKYAENIATGEADLCEQYSGQTEIQHTGEQKYLGFVLSSSGDNMANIRAVQKKSIGIVKTAINKLNSLKLGKYYFESAVIIMNVMVRPSILYASDTYYQLKETEIRHLERIEENYMRQVLHTTKGCPINQLYFSLGQYPARFEIQKSRLLFLKYILNEDNDSLLSKFFYLQLEHPTKGDWASTCVKDLSELRISESFQEIEQMSKNQFLKILKTKLNENAIKYLEKKQGSKGKENEFSDLSMADYLQPVNKNISILEKQKMFEVKTRMTNIPSNFPKPNIKYFCPCGEKEEMKHVYMCEKLNNGEKPKLEYMKLYSGRISEQIEVFRKFEKNLEKRKELTAETPRDQDLIHCSRQSIVMD